MQLFIARSLLVTAPLSLRRCTLPVEAALKPVKNVRLFGDLPLPLPVSERLLKFTVKAPTKIQASVMMPISRGEHAVIHAETGSGKTYAYLLPFLSSLHASRPCQLLIVVPSRELAVQTAATIERLWEHHGTQRAFLLTTTTESAETLAERLSISACPVVVATPRPLFALVQHLAGTTRLHSRRALRAPRSKALCTFAEHLLAVVIDEADAILLSKRLAVEGPPRQHVHDTASRHGAMTAPARFTLPAARALQALFIIRGVAPLGARGRSSHGDKKFGSGHRAERLQLVAASATVSYRLGREIARLLDLKKPDEVPVHSEAGNGALEGKRATGQRGRAGVSVPRAIRHAWVGVDSHAAKVATAAAVLRQLRPAATLLFIRDDARIAAACEALRAAGVDAVPLKEAMGLSADEHSAKSFLDVGKCFEGALMREGGDEESTDDTKPARAPQVLVSTTASARGLDMPMVDCVLLYGLPSSADSYVHLAGRTGRCGRDGHVVSLLAPEENSQVGLLTRQLGVSFKPFALAEVVVGTAAIAEDAERFS